MLDVLQDTMPARLRQGLIAYWPLADASAIDLKSALYDGGGPYDLTNNATATRAAGPSANLPNAAEFVAASSQYLSRSGFPTASRAQPFTVHVWAYPHLGTSDRWIISHADTGANQRSWQLRIAFGSTSQVAFSTSTDGTSGAQTTLMDSGFGSVSLDAWIFISAFWSPGRQGISVNGRDWITGTAGASLHLSTAAFAIGALLNSGTPGSFWDGRIAQPILRVGVTPLSDVRRMYNNGQGFDLARAA